jgi:hypothetical protein
LLVEILLAHDLVQEARSELATVMAFVERSGERRHLPELLRLEGECLRRSLPDVDDPAWSHQDCFRRALAVAREQGARFWELRAEASLGAIDPPQR